MNLQLENRTALVTGSTAGIGLAIAEALAAKGARVVVNGRTPERVEAAVAELSRRHSPALVSGVAADLTTEEGAETLFDRLPRTDILVNNLGIYEAKPFSDITDEDWMRLFSVNVVSGARLSRHYLPRMKEAGWGRILFVSSESALNVPPEMIHYGLTKMAQLSLARGLAETTANTAVTVNSLLPGPTRSEGVLRYLATVLPGNGGAAAESAFLKKMRPTSLLGRFAEAEEVASVAAFLCGPLASAINGAAARKAGWSGRSFRR